MRIEFESHDDDLNTQTISFNVRENNSMYIQVTNYNENHNITESSWYELKPKQLTQIIGSLLHLQSKFKNK